VFKRDVYHQTGWQALIDICIYYVSNCFVKTNLCSVSSKRERLDKMHLTKPWHGNEDDFTHHCLRDLLCSVADFGNKIQRNYFTTSHAKGRIRRHQFSSKTKGYQSSATSNSHVKKVPRRCKIIWMKISLWPSASMYLSTTKSENLKKHLFFCHFHTGDHSVNTNRPNLRSLKGKGIKRIHSFKTTTKQGKVLKCHRSHYCLDCSLETAICCESSFWWLGGA